MERHRSFSNVFALGELGGACGGCRSHSSSSFRIGDVGSAGMARFEEMKASIPRRLSSFRIESPLIIRGELLYALDGEIVMHRIVFPLPFEAHIVIRDARADGFVNES